MKNYRFTTIALLLALGFTSQWITPHQAKASVAVELTVDDLVTQSDAVAIVTARSKTSRWEEGRIVTYTQVDVTRPIAGLASASSSMVIRTLGGSVGNIGQIVHGEAILTIHEPCIIFVRILEKQASALSSMLAYRIVGLSQGLLSVRTGDDRVPRIESNPHGLSLLRPTLRPSTTLSIHNTLTGQTLDDAATHIQRRWNARKPKP